MAFQSIKISTRSTGEKKPGQTHLVAHPVGARVIQPEGAT